MFKEVRSRETGIKRMVDSNGKDYSAKVKNFEEKRGFKRISYIRSPKSSAKSAPMSISSEPVKNAAFQTYFSKFCRPLKGDIDYRIGKAIKKMGAGSNSSRLVKVASALTVATKAAKAAKASKLGEGLGKAKSFLGKNKAAVTETALVGNSLYATHDWKKKGHKSNMYHKASWLAGGAALGHGLGSGAAFLKSTALGVKHGFKASNVTAHRVRDILSRIPRNTPSSKLSKAQVAAVKLNRTPQSTAEAAFNFAGGHKYSQTLKSIGPKYKRRGLLIGTGYEATRVTDKRRKKSMGIK